MLKFGARQAVLQPKILLGSLVLYDSQGRRRRKAPYPLSLQQLQRVGIHGFDFNHGRLGTAGKANYGIKIPEVAFFKASQAQTAGRLGVGIERTH